MMLNLRSCLFQYFGEARWTGDGRQGTGAHYSEWRLEIGDWRLEIFEVLLNLKLNP